MTANDTQRAVAALRTRLPEPYRPAPRLVRTTTEALDGMAFCRAHEGPAEQTCDRCRVIDLYEPKLAEQIVIGLRTTEPLAAHLNAIDTWGHNPTPVVLPDGPNNLWGCPVCGLLNQPERCPAWSAADITRAINGTEATTS